MRLHLHFKQTITLSILLLFNLIAFSKVSIVPKLIVKENKKEVALSISKLDIDINTVGNIATTTFDITFKNPFNKVLEGEFEFPLSEGQNVCRYALDINGNMREGVIVEKAKARKAFETTVRRKIDPGLIEKTKGNNYKTRIYPIPAKGTKRVLIAFEETLPTISNSYVYSAPLNIEEHIDEVNISVSVYGSNSSPISINKALKFSKKSNENIYKSHSHKKRFKLPENIEFKIPNSNNQHLVFTENHNNNNYFYLNTHIESEQKNKTKPKKIGLYWDISSSSDKRDINKECELLSEYLKELGKVKVHLIPFNIKTQPKEKFSIKKGDSKSLINKIKSLQYDGATVFSNISNSNGYDEILIFTDGITTLGESKISELNVPTYVVNSSKSSDHSFMKYITLSSNGEYINLNKLSLDNAVDKLLFQNLRFISYSFDKNSLKDIYPSVSQQVDNSFSCAGKIVKNGILTINYGFGNKVTRSVKFQINKTNQTGFNIKRIWATKKINELEMQYSKNKDEITKTGKEYSIVTQNTSLIVLDRVEDYVQHNITPPAELLKQYNKLQAQNKKEDKESLSKILNSVASTMKSKFDWWNKDFSKKRREPKKTKSSSSNQVIQPSIIMNNPSSTNNNNNSNNAVEVVEENNDIIIRGVVRNKSTNALLPNVTVKVDNTSTQTQTNSLGMYSIIVPSRNSALSFSLGNYDTENRLILADNTIDVKLSPKVSNRIVNRTNWINLRGKVTAKSDGSELPGVNIYVKERSDIGIVTDENGNYNLRVPKDSSTLKFGFIGFKSQEIKVGNNLQMNVTLEEDSESLDEVVVVAYGIQRKTTVSGSVAKSIQGRAAGISVTDSEEIEEELEFSADVDLDDKINFKDSNNSSTINVRGWDSKAQYIQVLNTTKLKHRYNTYLNLKNKYKDQPSFYIEVADFFIKSHQEEVALIVLSNIAELKLESAELLRILGHRLQQLKQYQLAVEVFKSVLEIREEDPQSYRDLALAYEANNQPQQAIDNLYKVVTKNWDSRFNGVKGIVLNELNSIISKNNGKLELSGIDKRFIKSMPLDIRIVINWSSDNSDIDLWVTDPNNEKCFYKHKNTKIGGRISNDLTRGFGPEEFCLKRAIDGEYKINVKYYSDSRQSLSGPVTVQAEIYTNYGRKNQKKETITLSLKDQKKVEYIGSVTFDRKTMVLASE